MPQIRNIAPERRDIPAAGRVVDMDEVFEVDDATFARFEWPESIYEVVSTNKENQ